jgi:uncharacterized protein (DUF3084 family)
VTLLNWRRAWAVAVIAVVLAGCGGSNALDPAARRGLADAQAAADRAFARLSRLEHRVGALAGRVRERDARAESLAAKSDDLERSLERLGKAVDRLRSQSDGARERARAALATAESAARDLAVLTRRFDYHLSHYHGGG